MASAPSKTKSTHDDARTAEASVYSVKFRVLFGDDEHLVWKSDSIDEAMLAPSKSGRDSRTRRSRLVKGNEMKASIMLSRIVELADSVKIFKPCSEAPPDGTMNLDFRYSAKEVLMREGMERGS